MHSKRPLYTQQTFDHLKGLDGISDEQIKEHLQLYTGYVAQVNALNEELGALRERGRASGKGSSSRSSSRRRSRDPLRTESSPRRSWNRSDPSSSGSRTSTPSAACAASAGCSSVRIPSPADSPTTG